MGQEPNTELREFLRSRRAKITPEEAGLLPQPGTRRVPGLRREEVAQFAGVSVDYYVRLERGRPAHVSEAVLDAIARALRLNDLERAHLFRIARPSRARPRSLPPQRLRPGGHSQVPHGGRHRHLTPLTANPSGHAPVMQRRIAHYLKRSPTPSFDQVQTRPAR